MPLLDHFHPPLTPTRHWESFHSGWASSIADRLNEELLPENYFAEENVHSGARVEIDVATYEKSELGSSPDSGGGTATLARRTWTAPAPSESIPAIFPDTFEVRVFSIEGGARLVAAIEFVSPGNKDRPETRLAFVAKCASYLHEGVSLLIVDIVTNRLANMHNELMSLLNARESCLMPLGTSLYCAAYRPVLRNDQAMIDMWKESFSVGSPLPVMPLIVSDDLQIPIDLEATYSDLCKRRKLG
jgi:hypothetical protein